MSAPPHERFLKLFADEAEARLRRLGDHILALESAGSADAVAALLRDAHSLKGAAAVVGLTDVSTVAHRMEDLLEPYRTGAAACPPALVDRLLDVADVLQSLLPAIRRGEDTTPWTRPLCDRLGAAVDAEAGHGEAGGAPDPVGGPAQPSPPPQPPVAAPVAAPVAVSDMIELPAARVDDLVRSVGESAAASMRLGRLLGERTDGDPERITEFRDLSRSLRHLHEQTVRARMVPIGSITGRLHRAVRDTARDGGKAVRWEASGEDTELDRTVLGQLADSLLHLVRNAVDHGIEPSADRIRQGKPEQASVRFHARQTGSDVLISVTDDGRGIDAHRLRDEAARHGIDVGGMGEDQLLGLVFANGVSTAETLSQTSGRGVGLDVVRANVERLRGRIELASAPGTGTEFRITIPVTAAILPCLVVRAGGQRYALPMASVVTTQAANPAETIRAQGRELVWVGRAAVPVASLTATLGHTADGEDGPVVVVAHADRMAAYRVDDVVGQRDVMATGLGAFVPKLALVSGGAVEADGSILLVLDGAALATTVSRPPATMPSPVAGPAPAASPVRSVLVADDSLPVRELQRSILEHAGYRVFVADDGAAALASLASNPVDLVLTDVDMPRLNGFELTRAIRAQPQLANLPVLILSSKNAPEDHQEGMDAGADGYLVKDAFGEATLLAAVHRLIGQAA
jgi:two-component system chemotaxis sensor kinase CheA